MSINLSGASGSVVLRASGGGGGVGPTGPTGPSGAGGAISAVDSVISNTTVSTTSTTFINGSPVVSVTATTGTRVLISYSANCYKPGSSTALPTAAVLGVAVSGATTMAASTDSLSGVASKEQYTNFEMSKTFVLSGLTAGSNTFTLQYRVTDASSAWEFSRRNLVVQTIA